MSNSFGVWHRTRATLIHFLISALVLGVLVFITAYYWFPGPLFWVDGGWQGLRLVLLVDLVLGPLMSFILVAPGKPAREVVKDLSIVGAVQLAAFIWGGITVYQQRPVAVPFWEDRFYTIANETFVATEQPPEVLAPFGETPVIVYAAKPESSEQTLELTKRSLESSMPLYSFASVYSQLPAGTDAMIKSDLATAGERFIKVFVGEELTALEPGQYRVGLEGRYGTAAYIINDEGEIIDSEIYIVR